MMKTLIAAVSALALSATPALAAAANPASSLSIKTAARAGTPGKRAGKLAAPGAIVGLVLAAAVVAAGVFIVVDDDSDSN
jgi:hypothetical protein